MREIKIKVGAHLFGLISALWTLFSLFAVFDWFDARRYLDPFQPNAIPDWIIWGLHLLFISIAALCLLLERPRNTHSITSKALEKAAHHTAVAAFLAHLPLFAWWHGGALALHLFVHGSLLLLGFACLRAWRALVE